MEAEVEQELQSIPQDEASLAKGLPEELPSLFSTSALLQSELDRVTSNKAVKGLDSVRYQLPAPPLNAPSAAWQKAIDNAGSQLEHQSARLANLDVMGKYASNSWRVANYLVEKEIERLQTRVENVKNATEEVNRERKAKQVGQCDWMGVLYLTSTRTARDWLATISTRSAVEDAHLWQHTARTCEYAN